MTLLNRERERRLPPPSSLNLRVPKFVLPLQKCPTAKVWEKERERERERDIYIYIYRERERERRQHM